MKCACSCSPSSSILMWTGIAVAIGSAVFTPRCHKPEPAAMGAVAPAAREVVLKVEGMACEGCAQDVTEALKDVPGVEEARVSLKEGRAYVTLAAAGAPDLQRLIDAATNPSRTVTVLAKGEAAAR